MSWKRGFALALSLVLISLGANAQRSRPIEMIIPFPAGSWW